MRLNKNIMLSVLMVLIMLCIIGTASAEEKINENITASDADEVVFEEDISQDALQSESNEKLSNEYTVSSYSELTSAITSASDGDTIILNDGTYEFPSSSGTITLSKSLTFKGQTKDGVIITSPGTYSIFSATDAYNLKIQNLNFKEVATSGSGIVAIGGTGTLDVIDCSFKNCKAKAGAIRFYGTGDCTINGLTIENQKLDYSSATSYATALTLTGGAKYNLENVLIDSANYTYSSSYTRGVIYISSNAATATINDLTIRNCGGNMYGIINNAATTTITNSKIYNNTIPGATGNAIFRNSKSLTIEQTIITGNIASNSNGGYLFQDAGSSSVKTTFNLNYNYIADNDIKTSIYYTTNTQYVDSVSANYNYWGANYDDSSALQTATNIAQTTWANKDSSNNFVDQDGNPLDKTIPTPSSGSETGDIYVSENGNDENDGSSPANAVQSLKHAIELAESGTGKIYVIAGNYNIAETLTSTNALDIECESGIANITSTVNQLFTNTAGLKLTNLKFTSSSDNTGAIVNNGGDLTVDKCIFDINTQKGNAIYITGGTVNIANSVLLNPAGNSIVDASASSASITTDNNWWGTNTTPNTIAQKWIVMDACVDLTKINAGDEVTLTATFTKTNDGSNYTGTLPEFSILFTANDLNENVTVKNNQASVKYTVNTDDEATITSGSETIKIPLKLYDPPEIIYVNATGGSDANDGDEAHPVQSIAQAISLAKKGKIIVLEGTYTINNTLTVNDDLDIKGEGSVIIDGNSKRILNNTANLNITNIQFTNGFDSSAVIVNSGNLTLANTLFYSNINLNGYGASVIRNNKKLTINGSKFYENQEKYGNIYNNAGELFINNTEFFNNDLTAVANVATGLAIYSEAGNAKIENSKFYDNKGNFSVIYFLSKDSLSSTVINNLTINNCTFDNNELVRYGVIYSQKANTSIKDSTFTNNIVTKTYMGINGDGAAIYVYGEKVTVDTSVFINNKADDSGNDIYVYSGELNITDSVLINKNGYSIEKSDSAVVDANNNWWGANSPNTPVTVDKYVVMTVTSNDTNIETDDKITITASFDKTNDGSSYTGNLPEVFNVTFTSTSGNLNEVKMVKDKKAEVNYTVVVADKKITVTSNDANETLKITRILDIVYVSESGDDDNDGDRDAPVKTIAKAVELAQKGQIVILNGTYKCDDLGIISNDLNITGEGKVIIDADNNNRLLYVYNTSNMVLKNLILINGYTTSSKDESGALIGNAGNLTIINCTLANSNSEKNGGAIYNAGTLEVINSTFENNTADECGGAIFTQKSGNGIIPTLTVFNSQFRNNSAKGKSNYGGGAIYVQQAADGVSIVNSIFEDNTCIDYGGGAIEIAQTNVASIDNCTFTSNSANGQDYKTRSDYGGGAISFKGYYDSVRETLTITNSLFIDNEADEYGGGAIFAMYSTVNVQNSVLINNSDDHGIYVYSRDADIAPAKVTANDNWWGSNDNPKQFINRGSISRWAILTVLNASEIKEGESVKITVSINNYTTGSENASMANPIKVERPVVIYTNIANIEGTLVNGEFTTDYTVPSGLKIISAIVDSETQVLHVISTQTTINADNITGAMGDRVEYTIDLITSDNSIINTGSVEIYFGSDLIATISVSNSQANTTLLINKATGIYNITVKYIDETKEFVANDATATLNVTGINNIVTPENFNKFFDSDGELLSDIPFDEIIFNGTFNDFGVITINKAIKVTGNNAKFNDTVFKIDADNAELSNVTIELTKNYDETDGAAIYVGGNNVVISGNNITYNAPDNVQSYVIEVDIAEGVKITDNNIRYSAKSEGGVKTIAISVSDADGFVFEDNYVEANIPSVPIGYTHYPVIDYYSQAVHIEDSDDVSFKNNIIKVNYTTAEGAYDTIYAVHITSSDNSNVTGNDIELYAHDSGYGLVMDGENLKINNNNIVVSSEDYYAAGLNINSDSTAVVDGNNISATSKQVSYPIYLDDWYNEGSDINITNNNIKGDSNTVYGIYVQGNKTTIADNDIEVKGNYTMGISAYDTDLIAKNNNISSQGSNTGTALSPQSSVPVETTGICAAKGSINVTNNTIVSTGNTTIDAINTQGIIKDNYLKSAIGKGDATINSTNSTLVIDNNKTSEDPVVTPVIKLTGKNVNMYYADSSKYQVLVTIDGKTAKGVKVKFTFNGKTSYATTNDKGYATLNIKNNKLKPKKYTVTAEYSGKVIKNTIVVKQILKSKNKKVKKSAKKLVLKATLKKGKKAIKGKKVTFKFKGKKYKAKTNKKGVAKVTIKKKVIKKLKAGKKYTFKVTYLKDTVKKSVKVKK